MSRSGIVISLLFIMALFAADKFLVRGLRNNNPLNIKSSKANKWLGESGSDGTFVIFTDPVYGLRAGFKILATYSDRGLNTIRQIIGSFAPHTENETENYINFVSSKTGINPDSVVSKKDYSKIISAMVQMETGKKLDDDLIRKAEKLA